LAWLDYETQQVVSVAFPFNQGVEGKPEDNGQPALWGEDVNLPWPEWRELLAWLRGRPLIMHNGPFDCLQMKAGVGVPKGWRGVELIDQVVWDTMIVNKELDPLLPTGLKPTAVNLWGEQEGDENKQIKSYLRKAKLPAGRYDLVPWDIIGPYAAKDAELTLRLFFRQIERIQAGEARWDWIDREFQIMRILYAMTSRGLPYDAAASLDAAHLLGKRKRELEKRLPFRPTDVSAKQYFFGDPAETTAKGVECLGLIPYSTTEKGSPQLTAEIVGKMVEEQIPHAQVWADWSKLDTAISMWYAGYAEAIGPDGRLRTHFRQTSVKSGRFSVERINLQAVPHNYRLGGFKVLEGVPTPRDLIAQGFGALPGWSAWEVDLAQAELRVAAVTAKCVRMLELIHEGADLHGDGVREMFHVDKDDERWFQLRQAMKRGNFSLIFGVGWRKLQADIAKNTGLVLTDRDAEQFVKEWNRIYPEYQRAIWQYSQRVAKSSKVDLINGRARWYATHEDWHSAYNQYVQSSLAEFGKDWMIATEDLLTREKIQERASDEGIGGAGLLLVVHDSQVLLLPDDTGPALVEQIQGWAAEVGTEWFKVPMAADAARWNEK
jgi:DNA polymerase I-like protein with 3'-5' exonuclease and polymerase domains